MQKVKFLIFLFLSATIKTLSQCPMAGFTVVPDSVCAGIPLNLTNTSSGAITYQWDFCTGDLDTTIVPTGVNLGNPGGLAAPHQVKVVFDNGNYYAFIADFSLSKIVRLDFGPSLENSTPGVFMYPDVINNPFGLDVVKDGNNWCVLSVGYINLHLFRLDLGNDISSNTSTLTDLGATFGFIQPIRVKIEKDNGNYYAFVVNFNSSPSTINKIEFGSSLSNPPSNSSVLSDPSFNQLYGFDIVYDCSSNKYIGFGSNYNAGTISVIDYGSSLLNAGSVSHVLTCPTNSPIDMNVIHDGDDWNLLFISSVSSQVEQLILGNNLLNQNPFIGFTGNLGGLSLPTGINFINDSSKWYGIISNSSTSSIIRIKFENNCTASVPVSGDSLPQNIFYTGEGWQHIDLSVSNSNGFINFYTDSIFVSPQPIAGFTFTGSCINQTFSFNDTSSISQDSITGWQWDFGDGNTSMVQNPTHIYNNDSTYLVTLTATGSNGCSASFSDSIQVSDLPSANFSFPDSVCSETPVQFTDLSIAPAGDTITGWEWDFGDTILSTDTNPVHSFDSSGTYTVELIVFTNNGCPDTIAQTITIVPRPVVDFVVTNTCIGEITVFTNNTTIPIGSLTYDWDFGDTVLSTDTNPTHAYPAVPFTYTVQLIATSSNGCKDTLEQDVRISTKPNPSFTYSPDTACIGNPVQFINTSTIAAGDSIINADWDFGDGPGISSGDTVTHVYTASGLYNVTMTVTSLTDCDTFLIQTINVIESPVADFTFNDVCLDSIMNFTDQSTTPTGSVIDTIYWQFGDGDSAYGTNVSHVYDSAGIYNVTLTVINDFGCSGTIVKQVTVYDKPVASFSHSFACSGSNVNFTNSSFVPNVNDSIVAYFWDFGGVSTSTLKNPQHIYTNPGIYVVSLTVTSSHGCIKDTTDTVTVYNTPHFDFTYSHTCLGEITQFNFQNFDSLAAMSDSAFSWTWDFGDIGVSSNRDPSHLYSLAGTFTVTLQATALNSCTTVLIKNIVVHPVPVAAMLVSDSLICDGETISFTDMSTIPSGSISGWTWNFDDGSPIDINQNTSHLFDSVGTFLTEHIVTSNEGCMDTTSNSITVSPIPQSSFTVSTSFGSPPLNVSFINTTPGSTTSQWNFGDNTPPSFLPSPSHSFLDTGYYEVTLVSTNNFGCVDTATKLITVLIPYLEMGVKFINAIPQNNLLSISAELANLGNIFVNRFQITAWTENGSQINEQWEGGSPLAPGQILSYNFNARYEIDSSFVPSFFCVEISNINDTTDAIAANNRKCSALNDLFNTFEIYPNPVISEFSLGIIVPHEGTIEIRIVDMPGQIVKQYREIPVTKGYNEFQRSLFGLAQGIYAIEVIYGDNIKAKKLVKR